MSRSYRSSYEDRVAAEMTGVLMMLAIVGAGLALAFIIATLTESTNVYKERAFTSTRSARFLWVALAGLFLALLVAGVLSMIPDFQNIAFYLAAWSFLVWVIVVEGIDNYKRKSEPPPKQETTLQDVLVPWQFEDKEPYLNGNGNGHHEPEISYNSLG